MAISEITKVEVPELNSIYEKEFESDIKEMGKNFRSFFKELRNNKLIPAGKISTTYLSEPEKVINNVWKYKISMPVKGNKELLVDYKPHSAIKLVVTGSYKQFTAAYDKMNKYIKENNIDVMAPPYETYVKGPKLGFIMVGLESEIYFPIK